MPADARDALVERARTVFAADPRVLGAWLEGSLGRGTADAASDVDLHLAVRDAAFDGFVANPDALLARLAAPLGYLDVPLPAGRLFAAALAGPVRVDLAVERRDAIATAPREAGRVVLFDRDGVAASLAAAPPPAHDAADRIRALMRGCWMGTMWPHRFTQREDWPALLMNALTAVHQFAVPAMLIADGSPEFYRDWFSVARFLRPERRDAIARLFAQGLDAFAGIDRGAPDRERLARFHEACFATVWGAFRDACAATGVAYPVAVEREYRDYCRREMGVTVPPLN